MRLDIQYQQLLLIDSGILSLPSTHLEFLISFRCSQHIITIDHTFNAIPCRHLSTYFSWRQKTIDVTKLLLLFI